MDQHSQNYQSHMLRTSMSGQYDFVCMRCRLTDNEHATHNIGNTDCPGSMFVAPEGEQHHQPARLEDLRVALQLVLQTVEDEAYKVTKEQKPCRHTAALNEIHNIVSEVLGPRPYD